MEGYSSVPCHRGRDSGVAEKTDDVEVENESSNRLYDSVPNIHSSHNVEVNLNNEDHSNTLSGCDAIQYSEKFPEQLRELKIGSREDESTESVMEVVAIEEEVSVQNSISDAKDNARSPITLSKEVMVLSVDAEENITFEKIVGSNRNDEQKSEGGTLQQISDSVVSNGPQGRILNVKSCNMNENYENDVITSANETIHTSEGHIIPLQEKQTSDVCIHENSVIKAKSTDVAYKNLEVEITQDATIHELPCAICSETLSEDKEMPQLDCSNEFSDHSEKEQSEIDLIRPVSSVSNTSNSTSGNSETKGKCKREITIESDPAVLSRRQKQIDYGKKTPGYQRYKEMVSKDRRTRQDPQTPPKSVKYSRRAWDGLIKTWRRKLHNWDPPKNDSSDDEVYSLVSSSSSSFPTSDDSENLMDIPCQLTTEQESLVDDTENSVKT